MSFIQVKVTNPTERPRSYVWVDGMLSLPAGGSRVLNFDPLSRVDSSKGYLQLARKDVTLGRVILEYKIEAPCKVVSDFSVEGKNSTVVAQVSTEKVPEKKKKEMVGLVMDIITDGAQLEGVLTPLTDKAEMAQPTRQPNPVVKLTKEDFASAADLVSVVGGMPPVKVESPAKWEMDAEVALTVSPTIEGPITEVTPAEEVATPVKPKKSHKKKNTF